MEGPARAALLLDLGRIYKDRLGSQDEAQVVYEELLREDPSSRKALEFLAEHYEKSSQWEELFKLHLGSVETTWDPGERLERTRLAADIAQQRLQDPKLAIEAWERLWKLGGGLHQVRLALTQLYRDAGQWKALADFLFEDAQVIESADGNLQLREVVELCLYGANDLERAKETVDLLLDHQPEDAMALLASAEVLARREDWDSLLSLLVKAEKELDATGALGLRRWIADALWKGGRQEDATEIYRKVLHEFPDDLAAAKAVEQAFTKAERHEELVELLETQLARAEDPSERADVLAKLAEIAHKNLGDPQKAIDYWKQRIEAMEESDLEGLSALGKLYDEVEAYEDLAQVLGRELELRRDPSGKRELLSRLGVIYSQKLQDDERAEEAWRRMLVLDPEDGEARRELMQLHRRRGEYEALDRSLVREINLADEEVVEELCREAAKNVEENISDRERSFRAWFRVLDRAPRDPEALAAISRVMDRDEEVTRWATFLERRMEAAEEVDDKVSLGLELAGVWRERGEEGRLEAAAVYERVLGWKPHSEDAVGGLVEHWISQGEVHRAMNVLEFGSLKIQDTSARVALNRRAASLIPGEMK